MTMNEIELMDRLRDARRFEDQELWLALDAIVEELGAPGAATLVMRASVV